jgi:septum site-determining protein MinC
MSVRPTDERDFRLLALTPTAPVMTWLSTLHAQLEAGWRPGPVVLDVSAARLNGPGIRAVLAELAGVGVRVTGLVGTSEDVLGGEAVRLPPVLQLSEAAPAGAPAVERPHGLFHDRSLRSGQVLRHAGDVTIHGGVASGAEVISGGWIHVYGTLTGRAVCDRPDGRIFCQRLAAEFLGIGGVFLTADEIDPRALGRSAMAWRDAGRVLVGPLDV